mmetsp:Transcript_22544/g.39693  ORF Transcript_22544/g.39693 Transcript_22544/m.39693 type:complete len:669 (+) Transcript_22544:191-2197(+)
MILSALLILNQLSVISGAKPVFPFSSMASPEPEENVYNKYAKYPAYCSTPEEMEQRAVPPLQGNSNDGSSKLIHVTALIRHGARTPFGGAPRYQCWDGYWDNEETGIWNCDLKTYISPPAATKEKGQFVDGEGLLEEEPDFLFEKRYDALTISPEKTGNNLNGTCQLGQLLMRGYDQELRNGLHLRQAYFYDGDKTADEHAASDSRMRLWDLTQDSNGGRRTSTPVIGDPTKEIYQEPNLRYRADDEQRTLMSGQVLLRGLFESELKSSGDDEAAVIRLHTADYFLDTLTINKYTCPRTLDLQNEAYASDEYKKWIDNSVEVKAVKTFAKEELGMDEMPYSMLDCMMTTICTDRTLPDSLNDYDGSLGPTPWEESVQSSSMSAAEGESGDFTNMFERIANFAIKNFTFPYKYNNAAYPKLGMGPLWKEIMANILPIVDSANNPSSGTPPPKLALFSGHDTTLMPILATLGDNVWDGTDWAPYASMLQIEIHEITNSDETSDFPSGYAFRLIFNGKVLTSKMDGCAAGSELCDSQVLVKQVEGFAKYQERDCASTASVAPPADDLMTEMKDAAETLVAAQGGVWVVMSLVIVSMALGSMLTCFLMKRRMRKPYGYRQDSSGLGDLSMSVMDDDENHFHSEDSPGIDSVGSAKYGSTHSDEMKFDENNLI